MPRSVEIHVEPTVLRSGRGATGGPDKPWLTQRYRDYLQSPEWRAVRAAALDRANHKCSRCGATQRLEVHHLSYLRLGHEQPEDLRVLCSRCHDTEHYVEGWTRRIDAIARKRYGYDWRDRGDADAIEERIVDWLENGADR